MNVHNRLMKDEFRFILLEDGGKPMEPAWREKNNYTYRDKKLKDHVWKNLPYAILCGKGNLVAVSFKDREAYDKYADALPLTLMASLKTLSKVSYYYCENARTKIIRNKKNKHVATIHGKGSYCLAPEKSLTSSSWCDYVFDVPITRIKYEELEAVFDEK
ncbi:hypothetical protein JXA12_05775 [Candidatus Woesearchaeota archaeon]|nr:hypothetical protein [Candidatus Woesearchaeota archaeon]